VTLYTALEKFMPMVRFFWNNHSEIADKGRVAIRQSGIRVLPNRGLTRFDIVIILHPARKM
jgi:hypothetical protein